MTAFFQELIHVGIYKRSQGRITRQLTFGALAVTVALGAWRSHGFLQFFWLTAKTGFDVWVPGLLVLAGLWICYRLVNLPAFADFLIAVEAEMYKVSWPTRAELFRASVVVIILIIVLAVVLFGFDYFWRVVFKYVFRIL